MTKYKEYVERMLSENKKAFESFRSVHDKYSTDTDKYQDEFNKEGEKILPIVHDWENKLCLQSEKGGYGKFAAGLAEKFQAEVRAFFPMIDHIGLKTNTFSIKRIKLF